MRVIIKNPGEQVGHFEEIENELIPMREIVGGPIETVYLGRGLVMIVNEEGKLWMLPENFRTEYDVIVGTAIVAGTCGDEFADCPISLNLWKKKLARWGNDVGEIPLTDIRTRFTSYKVDFLSTDTYLADGSPRITAWNMEDGPIATITVCLEGKGLAEGQAYVDTNNCPWAPEWIETNGLGTKTNVRARSGYCTYPLYQFDMEQIRERGVV